MNSSLLCNSNRTSFISLSSSLNFSDCTEIQKLASITTTHVKYNGFHLRTFCFLCNKSQPIAEIQANEMLYRSLSKQFCDEATCRLLGHSMVCMRGYLVFI